MKAETEEEVEDALDFVRAETLPDGGPDHVVALHSELLFWLDKPTGVIMCYRSTNKRGTGRSSRGRATGCGGVS